MNKSNQSITFKGAKLRVSGRGLQEGDMMPAFRLVGVDMAEIDQSRYKGKVLILCPVPSVDTPVCSIEGKRFNDEAIKFPADIAVLMVSLDLPFAQKRWCGAEDVTKIDLASDYKFRSFGEGFGVFSPDMGLLVRAVFVADRQGKVQHVEYVSEIAQEPDYSAAISKAKSLV